LYSDQISVTAWYLQFFQRLPAVCIASHDHKHATTPCSGKRNRLYYSVFLIFIARQHAGRDSVMANPSARHTGTVVCNDIVTNAYKFTYRHFPPPDRGMTSFFSATVVTKFQRGTPSAGALNRQGGKICDFQQKLPCISVQDRPMVTIDHK